MYIKARRCLFPPTDVHLRPFDVQMAQTSLYTTENSGRLKRPFDVHLTSIDVQMAQTSLYTTKNSGRLKRPFDVH